MAKVEAHIHIVKRWFFWPATVLLAGLWKIGIIKDLEKAGKWLANNAMRIEVR